MLFESFLQVRHGDCEDTEIFLGAPSHYQLLQDPQPIPILTRLDDKN